MDGRQAIFLWGASGHARSVADAIRAGSEFAVAGHVDDVTPEPAPINGAMPLRCIDQALASCVIHLAIGNNRARAGLSATLPGVNPVTRIRFASIIHPTAIVSPTARIGIGCFIGAHAYIGPQVVVGDHTIINTAAVVEHDCMVGRCAHVAPGALLAGGVTIGELGFVGLGARVIERIAIGAGAIIGAGAVVVDGIPPGVTAVGVPARVLAR